MKEFIEKLIGRLKRNSIFDKITNSSGMNVYEIIEDVAKKCNNGWIPCSERLPEEKQEVMLTFRNSSGLYVGETTYKNRMFFYVTDTEFGYYEEVYKQPIAWKPKDAPYQPKGE